ncbi:hypothetical protein HY605_02080, partial [Candidatus Peregrinibacteria bacterium]|nr:hypothetical protein [Candidatus Peregrinibacteria bacterium]
IACCAGTPDDDLPIIYAYTKEQAVEDGVLIPVGSINTQQILFTTGLYYDGFEGDELKIKEVVIKGLELLQKPDLEDTDYTKLRVIEKGKIWVVWNSDGYTFMKPEDY